MNAEQERKALEKRRGTEPEYGKVNNDGDCMMFVPRSYEDAQRMNEVVSFLTDAYNEIKFPRPKPAKDARGGSGAAPWNHWIMAEGGVADYEDAKGEKMRDSTYFPDLRIKPAWIPEELYDLTLAAYRILEQAGQPVPEGYGALIKATRMTTKGLSVRVEDGINEQHYAAVWFNFSGEHMQVGARRRYTPYGTATVFDALSPVGIEKDENRGPEYAVVVRFVPKGTQIFRWQDKAAWEHEHYSKERKPKSRPRERLGEGERK